MASEDTAPAESEPQVTFKVKTSNDGNHTITMSENATVLDLKNKLAGDDYEKVPAERQRLIYSGRVMKNEEPLSTYKIKPGNTVHMVKSAQSNAAQNPAGASAAGSTPRATPAVPTNMAAGTANNPLAGLTGARYAGHMGLPGMEMFGADGGMGAPPSEDQIATLLEDPNMQQTLNEALNNPAMIDMMIQSTPHLRNNPRAREMLQSPEFRQMMTNPQALRQAAQLRRMLEGRGGGGFPAPGVTDTTPAGAAGSPGQQNASPPPFNPFMFPGAFGAAAGAGGQAGANPFAALFGGVPSPAAGQTPPTQSPPPAGSAGGQGTPNPTQSPPANPFAALFPGAGAGAGTGDAAATPFALPQVTPEMMQEAMAALRDGRLDGLFGSGLGGGLGGTASPPPPPDNRPPEERYAEQLRQLNDMGFFDFDRNVEALRRSGGSVQGAIEQLLR
ncbi:hypothetical protein F5884DRAFT_820837 [Xylogone sp. PMI_703]|nr:hypothetical protein F5884DRAFT_820837 [Xylogone sp. PMI_703]